MSSIYYYLTLFPTETLIASMLDPEKFGAYMTTSSKRGSHERIIFAEVKGGFSKDFDWDYAKERCVPHRDGKPKHSVYLSVYRVLERVPFSALGDLHLTTPDGRTLTLSQETFPPDKTEKPYHVYQELCPVQPLVVSSLAPGAFGDFIINGESKISMPALCYCDLKVIDLNDLEHTGNVGPLYDHNLGHLIECIAAVTERGKITKTLDRTFAGSFRFQIVKDGFALVNKTEKLWYPMPTEEELATRYYDWSRSAMII
jgi:hypothetical protein